MWPAVAAGRGQDRAGPASATTGQGARHTAGSRLPCTATSGPRRSARPRSSGTRQSTPTTSAPASAMSAEQLAGADAEVDAGHAESRRGRRRPWRWPAARSGGSRPGTRAPPSCRRAGRPAAPASTWARSDASGQVGQAVQEGGQRCRVAVHERLGLGVGPGTGRPRSGSWRAVNGAPAKPIRGTVQLADQDADRPRHLGGVVLGLERSEAVEVGWRGGTGRRRPVRRPA